MTAAVSAKRTSEVRVQIALIRGFIWFLGRVLEPVHVDHRPRRALVQCRPKPSQASDEVTSKKIFGWSLEVEPSSSSEGFRASFMGGRSTPERARRGAPRRARWFSPRESSQMMRGTPTRW